MFRVHFGRRTCERANAGCADAAMRRQRIKFPCDLDRNAGCDTHRSKDRSLSSGSAQNVDSGTEYFDADLNARARAAAGLGSPTPSAIADILLSAPRLHAGAITAFGVDQACGARRAVPDTYIKIS